MQLKKRQTGLTFLGLLFVGGLLAFLGVIVAQIVPTYLEYLAVDKAVKKAAAGATVAEVRNIFDRAAAIDDIRTITGKDLEVGKQGDKVVVSYDYSREVHIAGPAYVLMKYQGSSQ
ncbi:MULTISPECIES: DUF4845 domain-containing protein [Hydrogenophaga]|uniref:DUF4845 domain-containing protein n=1 Tax=Hydrogenophaga electricum TaxID=1230953 RepID=A0ABQ6BZS3_9BURK|nr:MULTISPECIES: DUF4845 domain-containing protein [Hydrogenophaga]GLS13487.1 hypothetical protein GCM10007935_09170 [Hydrogenophaga electricum]